MGNVEVSVEFAPQKLRAFSRNEAKLNITLKNASPIDMYWCECEVSLNPPLSLARDAELNLGRTRAGILKPNSSITKVVNIFTRPNNYPDDYMVSLTVYVYDQDAAIFERVEKKVAIQCVVGEEERPIQERKDLRKPPEPMQ